LRNGISMAPTIYTVWDRFARFLLPLLPEVS
jgi:hypothetical protein